MATGYVATASDTGPGPVEPVRMAWGDRSTHVLVEQYLLDGLRLLSERTRVTQSQYMRQAVADVLAKHEASPMPLVGYHERVTDRLVSIVFRLDTQMMGHLVEMAKRTRVRQSEYLREAIVDLLRRYDDLVRAPEQIRLPLPGVPP